MRVSHTTIVVVALVVTGFVAGLLLEHASDKMAGILRISATLLATGLVFGWYLVDSNRRGYPRTPLLSIAVVAVAFVAIPYYLFRSRGFKGGAIATGWAILIFIALELAIAGGGLVASAVRT
jgi:hypothetical protein